MDFETLEWAKTNDLPYISLVPSLHHDCRLPSASSRPISCRISRRRARKSSTGLRPTMRWRLAKATRSRRRTPTNHRQLCPLHRARPEADRQRQFAHRCRAVHSESAARSETARGAARWALHRPRPGGVLARAFLRSHGLGDLPPYTSVFNNYLRTELGYKVDMPYKVFALEEPGFRNGIGAKPMNGFPNTAPSLRAAWRRTRF